MMFSTLLRDAQAESRRLDFQHIIVAFGLRGFTVLGSRTNTSVEHAEVRVLADFPTTTRLLVYRFNSADLAREPRASLPCFACTSAILRSIVRRVECYTTVPVSLHPTSIRPYDLHRSRVCGTA